MNLVTQHFPSPLLSLLTLLLTCPLAWPAFGRAPVQTNKPNFVVILCDNLGYGDIEPFGSESIKTPNLNRMAIEGMRLTHFYVTAGVCTPSRASLMTGCYAQRVGMHDNPRDGQVLRPVSPYGLHEDEETIAELLRDAGYATGLIGKWHLGDQPVFLPTRHGFDEYLGIPYSDDMTRAVGLRLGERYAGSTWPELPLMRNEQVIEAPTDRNHLTQRYTQEALRFISDHSDQPFFLVVSQAMPGSTKTPFASDAFRGRSQAGPWGDAVEELDWSTGQILDHLRKLELAENTLVIWTSDNGAPGGRGSNGPLYGQGYTTSEGAFRVPTLAWMPGGVPAQVTCEAQCSMLDLLPTFVKLAGASPPKKEIDGHDIWPLLSGRDQNSPYQAFFYFERDQLQAVRSGPWKLFLPLGQFTRHPHFQKGASDNPILFHLLDDVGCQKNVAEQHPDVVSRLSDYAQQARQTLGDRGLGSGSGQRKPGQVNDPRPLPPPAK